MSQNTFSNIEYHQNMFEIWSINYIIKVLNSKTFFFLNLITVLLKMWIIWLIIL